MRGIFAVLPTCLAGVLFFFFMYFSDLIVYKPVLDINGGIVALAVSTVAS